uniref:Putative camp-responsive element modulator n=1 Tax=Corethrella appendiculata TaxID=1370023 RepID=U5EXI8_9DIPT
MESIVEENGSSEPLSGSNSQSQQSSESGGGNGPTTAVLTSSGGTNIVQIIPTQSTIQAQSVIQQNQQSVIQTATGNLQPVTLPKGVLLVSSKPNSVIHTTQGSLQAVQIKQESNLGGNVMTDTNSEDSQSDDDTSPKKRRDLTRRPSYRKILNDLGGGEIVLSSGTLQLANAQGEPPALHTISGGGVVQYTQGQDGQIYVPLGGNVQLEDQSRKREMRLLKNREAARECRRKKKEYIKCLENRVAVLENQNKALIEELKSLKELYCQQKSD